MAVYKSILVDIPDDKGVHVKSAGAKGEKYVYKYVKHYRNANKEPRSQAKSIGKYDESSGKMYPNNNYFTMYNVSPFTADIEFWDYGYSYLVLKVCRDLNLLEILNKKFPDKAMSIIAIATYMIHMGNIMDGIDDWQQRNYFSDFNSLLTSQSTSRIFSSISVTQIHKFFKSWIKEIYGGGSVCYDVTSISSYSENMTEVERGYNRDGDDLAQYNLGLFCDESTKMPLYYNRYNGSLTDKTNLSAVLGNAKSIGIDNVKMILDGGFWSHECITSLSECCSSFIVGMPGFLKESKEIIANKVDNIVKYEHELSEVNVYCVQEEKTLYGVSGRVLVFYDLWNHANLCAEMSSNINRLKTKLIKLKRLPKGNLNQYTKYFKITKHQNDNGFDYEEDYDKIEKLRKSKGFFLIFTTDMISTPSEILYYYRAKDADEKLFSQIKVEMEGRRIRTHNSETTEGKTFVTFIASVIRTYMERKLSSYLNDNKTSVKKVINQLSNITIMGDKDGYRLTKALTKKQKDILSVFDAEVDIVNSINCIR